MKIKKLMFVTKFEQLGFDALKSLLVLRKAGLEHVVFVNVIERERFAMSRVGYRKDEEIRLRETANIRFIDWAESLFEMGMEAGVYIVVGSLVSEVLKAAEKEAADLIVIGRSHKGVLKQLYTGSDITELLRRSVTPVLVYKHMSETTLALEQPFEKPLLATDWSPACEKAAAYLKTLKGIIEEIHLVHVLTEKELADSPAHTSHTIQKARKQTRQKLEAVCELFEQQGIAARAHIYVGDAEDEIEKAAREHQASMIVMGSSAKAYWLERWIGSTPREIAEKSAFPCLLIPPEKSAS